MTRDLLDWFCLWLYQNLCIAVLNLYTKFQPYSSIQECVIASVHTIPLYGVYRFSPTIKEWNILDLLFLYWLILNLIITFHILVKQNQWKRKCGGRWHRPIDWEWQRKCDGSNGCFWWTIVYYVSITEYFPL